MLSKIIWILVLLVILAYLGLGIYYALLPRM